MGAVYPPCRAPSCFLLDKRDMDLLYLFDVFKVAAYVQSFGVCMHGVTFIDIWLKKKGRYGVRIEEGLKWARGFEGVEGLGEKKGGSADAIRCAKIGHNPQRL